MTCPTCGSHDISKNGTTRRGKQNYKCRDCNRQFVEDPQWKPKDTDTRALVNLLLLGPPGSLRVGGKAMSTLATRPRQKRQQSVVPKVKGKLNVQMDELWPFVANKGNNPYPRPKTQ